MLKSFITHFQVWAEDVFWEDWEVVSSIPQDVVSIVVKFWTGRVADEDVEQYLFRYCVLLQPAEKLLDQFGMWYGVRRYRVKLRRNQSGELIQIPNTIMMGPYTGKISYTGQIQRSYICNSKEHQVKDCDQIKCWKCGQLGHKGKACTNEEVCGLCGEQNHSFSFCPKSYSNQVKSRKPQQPSIQTVNQNKDISTNQTNVNNMPTTSWTGKDSSTRTESKIVRPSKAQVTPQIPIQALLPTSSQVPSQVPPPAQCQEQSEPAKVDGRSSEDSEMKEESEDDSSSSTSSSSSSNSDDYDGSSDRDTVRKGPSTHTTMSKTTHPPESRTSLTKGAASFEHLHMERRGIIQPQEETYFPKEINDEKKEISKLLSYLLM